MKYKDEAERNGKVLKFPTKFRPPEEEKQEVNFGMFAFAIVGGQVEIAGKILGQLLSLNEPEAQQAASHYHKKYLDDHSIQAKAMHIRHLIKNQENNAALMEIFDCFGLQGPPAIAALESMRKIVEAS